MKWSTMPVMAAAAAAAVTVAVVDDEDGIQWRQWWGRSMAATVFDGVRQ